MSAFARRLQQASQSSSAPVVVGPLDELSRVAWHNGPSYYANFANPGMLASTATVPLFEWYGNGELAELNQEKALGINGFIALTAPTKLSDVATAGLVAIPSYGEYTGTPGVETVGWHVADEPDMNFGPGWGAGQGFKDIQDLAATLPADNRIVHNNYGKGILYWESDADAATFINGGNISGSWRQGIVSSDLYWYAGIQSLQGDAAGYLQRPASQVARAQNYGWMIDRQRYLQTVGPYAQGPKPIYGFIETSHPFGDGSMPTPLQMEGAVWNSFIHEATGIVFFHHSFLTTTPAWSAGTQYKLGDNIIYAGNTYCAANLITPTLGTIPTSDSAWVGPIGESSVGLRNPMVPGMSAQLVSLTSRIKALAPVINTQSIKWTFNRDLETMLKAPGDGFVYVFAMQTINDTSGTYTLTLPAGVSASTIDVLNESRSLTSTLGTYVKTYTYTGGAQNWTVPAGVTSITVDMFGASGGSLGPSVAGKGAQVSATIPVTPGETIQINVGGKGVSGQGGWNGGGTPPSSASGGGGSSDIRQGGNGIGDRTLVAGGGGGVGNYGGGDNGGSGGLNGVAGAGDGGGGGTQTTGGGGQNGGSDGVLGLGGDTSSDGGGGGGGYYGGGGGGYYHGGGGGGSSYTTPDATNVTVTTGVQSDDGYVVISTTEIPAESRTFDDSFSDEYSCHIYKITL